MPYVYVHGFNSSPASNTLRLLRQVFPAATGLVYPCSGLFAPNLCSLKEQAESLCRADRSPLVLVGSSLGGFYASQLAALLHCPCALFNPVVFPAEALRPMLGRNIHFHTHEEWDFTPDMLESYAHFQDTRGLALRRLVVLGRRDSLLDPQVAEDYWQGHATLHHTDDEHSLTTLDEVTRQELREMEKY